MKLPIPIQATRPQRQRSVLLPAIVAAGVVILTCYLFARGCAVVHGMLHP